MCVSGKNYFNFFARPFITKRNIMVFYRSKEDPWLTRKRISLRRRSLPCHTTDPPTALMYGNTRLYIDMAIYSLLGSSVVLIAEIVIILL